MTTTANHPSDQPMSFRQISILGLPFFAQKREQWRSWLVHVLQSPHADARPTLICTPNAEQLVQAYQDTGFWRDLQQADLLLPDGIGPVLASYWFDRHHPMAERLAGADVVLDVLLQAKRQNLNVLIVGGRDYAVINQFGYAPVTLPLPGGGTITATWLPGYADITHPTPSEHATVRFVINQQKPAIVLVAFGAPWQEAWSVRHLELLGSVRTRLVMVVGGAVDFMLDKVPRAPLIMRQYGLEWLFRLVLQPWRWQRQLRLVSFVRLLLSGCLKGAPTGIATVQKDAAWRD